MPNLSIPLSENFILRELLQSNIAERDEALKREQANPPADIIENIQLNDRFSVWGLTQTGIT